MIKRMRAISASEIAFRLRECVDVFRERSRRGSARPRLDDIREAGSGCLPARPADTFSERERVVSLWRDLFPDSVDETISLADGICVNRIPAFSDIVSYDERVDWHLEHTSGRRSPLKFYRDVDTMSGEYLDDAKMIWEPNRHNFMVHLGKAYWASGNRKYFHTWRELVLGWIEDNPYNRGVNWRSSLELAIRSINWIWCCNFFIDLLQEDRELQEKIFITLYRHGEHIRRHLSCYYSPNTHLTGEALGLHYLGRAFPQMRSASEWSRTGCEILEAQLPLHVLDDGGYFEMATYYHKYTIDFYLHFILLGGASLRLADEVVPRIKKSIRHLALISGPDGAIPLLGDSDGGRLVALGGAKDDVRGVCCTAAVFFRDREMKRLCGGEFREETLWLAGSSGFDAFRALEDSPPKAFHYTARDTGLFSFRTGLGARDAHLLVDCGEHGWGACGHAHSDLLSFEWFSNGVKVVTDPGTYRYSGADSLRDELRSSQAHNTISINGASQSVPAGTFKWNSIAHPLFSRAAFLEAFGYFEGGHDAYLRFGCTHTRIALFFGAELSVFIDLIGLVRPIASLLYNLQFGEGYVDEVGDGLYQHTAPGGGAANCIRLIGTADFTVDLGEGVVCRDYNAKAAAPRLRLHEADIAHDHAIVSLLSPERRMLESFYLDEGNGIACNVSQYEYFISFEGTAGGGSNGDHRCSVFRSGPDETLIVLRNTDVAFDAAQAERFRSDCVQELLIAVLKEGALHLKTEDPPSSVAVPHEIDEVYLDGTKIRHERIDGIIRLAGF